MPNIPGRGLFGRPAELGPGPGLAAVNIVGSLPGETTARPVARLYAADENGVPVVVWARTAQATSSATRLYVVSNTSVQIGWVQPSPIEADAWEVRRADGSLVETATWNGVSTAPTSVVDLNPRPISGSYTVTARLGSTSAAPASTPTIDLSAPVGGLNAVFLDPFVQLSWTAPAYGRPDGYQVWRNGVLITTLAGVATFYNDGSPNRGIVNAYQVIPVLSGLTGQAANDTVAVTALAPALLTATRDGGSDFVFPPGETGTGVLFGWTHNSGARTGYELQWAFNPSSYGVGGSNAEGDGLSGSVTFGPNITSHKIPDIDPRTLWFFRVRTLSDGGASVWYQAGPVT